MTDEEELENICYELAATELDIMVLEQYELRFTADYVLARAHRDGQYRFPYREHVEKVLEELVKSGAVVKLAVGEKSFYKFTPAGLTVRA